jgi:hypothetical protein
MNEGRIIEEGIPRILAQNPNSEYAKLLELDREVIRETWSTKNWTGLRIEDGILVTSDCE